MCTTVLEVELGCGHDREGVCSDVFEEELDCGNDRESVCSDVLCLERSLGLAVRSQWKQNCHVLPLLCHSKAPFHHLHRKKLTTCSQCKLSTIRIIR